MAKQSLLNNYNLRRIMEKKLTIRAHMSNTWGNTKSFNFFISGNIVNGTNAHKNALRVNLPAQLLCNMDGASFVGRFVRMNSHPYRLEHKPSTSYLSYERIASYA